MNKKITRKEFLLSALSVTAVFLSSKIPSVGNQNIFKKKNNNTYGNYSYGGVKKNV